MMHVCPSCGREYDFETQPSGWDDNNNVVCVKCAELEDTDTIKIDSSDGFHAIRTNDKRVFDEWQREIEMRQRKLE